MFIYNLLYIPSEISFTTNTNKLLDVHSGICIISHKSIFGVDSLELHNIKKDTSSTYILQGK